KVTGGGAGADAAVGGPQHGTVGDQADPDAAVGGGGLDVGGLADLDRAVGGGGHDRLGALEVDGAVHAGGSDLAGRAGGGDGHVLAIQEQADLGRHSQHGLDRPAGHHHQARAADDAAAGHGDAAAGGLDDLTDPAGDDGASGHTGSTVGRGPVRHGHRQRPSNLGDRGLGDGLVSGLVVGNLRGETHL